MSPSLKTTTAVALPSEGKPGEVRLPELDGIRGIGILMVIVWHWFHLQFQAPPHSIWSMLNIPLRLSWSGVDLFFILSGFLIGSILLSKRTSRNYFRVFYLRRMFRILPLYSVFLLICTVLLQPRVLAALPELQWMFQHKLPLWTFYIQSQNLAMAWFGTFANQAMNITWSLAVEEQFYIVLPFLIRYTSPRRLPAVLLTLIGSAILLRQIILLLWPQKAVFISYVLLPTRCDPLLLGVLGAWMWQNAKWRTWLLDHRRLLTGSLAAGAVILLLLAVTAEGVIMSVGMTRYGYTVLALAYFAFLLTAITHSVPALNSFLNQSWLRWIGTISYGIYLLHEMINGIVHSLITGHPPRLQTWSDAGLTIFALILTLLVASASWTWFERPIVEFGRREAYS